MPNLPQGPLYISQTVQKNRADVSPCVLKKGCRDGWDEEVLEQGGKRPQKYGEHERSCETEETEES